MYLRVYRMSLSLLCLTLIWVSKRHSNNPKKSHRYFRVKNESADWLLIFAARKFNFYLWKMLLKGDFFQWFSTTVWPALLLLLSTMVLCKIKLKLVVQTGCLHSLLRFTFPPFCFYLCYYCITLVLCFLASWFQIVLFFQNYHDANHNSPSPQIVVF